MQVDRKPREADLLRRPWLALAVWGLPLAAGWTADALPISHEAATLVWAAALAVMGAGCAYNAMRCGRLHCFVAAPVLFLGALATAVVAVGPQPLGPHTASYIINSSLALALLSLLVEPLWGRYRSAAS